MQQFQIFKFNFSNIKLSKNYQICQKIKLIAIKKMESSSFYFDYNHTRLVIQIIKMNNSFFIYIATEMNKLENLSLSIKLGEESVSSTLIDDIDSNCGKKISNRLSFLLNKPIFLSMNIPDEYWNLNLGIRMEEALLKELKKLS